MKRFLLINIIFLFIIACVSAQTDDQRRLKVLTGNKEGTYYQMMNDINRLADSVVLIDSIVGFRFEIKQVPKFKDSLAIYRDPNNGITKTDTIKIPILDTYGNQAYEEVIFPITDSICDTIPYIDVLTSEGNFRNYQKLISNEYRYADVYFLQYDVLLYQELKQLRGNQSLSRDVRILLPLGNAEIHLITRRDAEIDSLPNLEKKRVGVGVQGTGITADIIKERTGIKWKNVYVGFNNALSDLLNNRIDAFFYVGMAPVYKLANTSPLLKNLIKLVPVRSDSLKGIYEETTIPDGTYDWQDSTISTYNVKIMLATNISRESSADRRNIEKFMNLILDNKDVLTDPYNEFHPKWNEVDLNIDLKPPRFRFDDIEWKAHKVAKKLFINRPSGRGGR